MPFPSLCLFSNNVLTQSILPLVKVTQPCPTPCDPMDYTVRRILQARILEWVTVPFSRDLPNPGTEPRSPALQVDSLPAEPQEKPKNTGVGSLCLLQQIFLTQKSNQSLLRCRRILYHLSHQGAVYVFSMIIWQPSHKMTISILGETTEISAEETSS